MLTEVLQRLSALLVLLLLVSLIVFGLTYLIPGDPALTLLGDHATPEQIAAVRMNLGLDDPWPARYWDWVSGFVTGDLGTSLFSSYSVAEAITSRIGVTISLVLGALVVSVIGGIALGTYAGMHQGRLADRLVLVLSSAGIAVPNFWLGIVLATFVGGSLGWFPTSGYVPADRGVLDWAAHLALPILTLAAAGLAEVARQTRASVTDTLQMDFVVALQARGFSTRRIVGHHVLRLALIPVITVAGLQVSRLFGMSALVEAVFGLPGVGSLLVRAVFERDIPVMQGTVMLVTVVVVVTNLLVDVSYRWLNPKVAT